MNKNQYTQSWRVKERIETLDLPRAEDNDHPVWVKRTPKLPDAYERELERLNRAERIERYRRRW